MLFNSHIFLFAFLPVTLGLWALLRNRPSLRLAALTAASYVFYGYWDYRFTFLMLISTLVDYVAGSRIFGTTCHNARIRWLLLSLVCNLGLLGFFKYTGFLFTTLNAVVGSVGGTVRFPSIEIILPIGISFYTFQSMSYSIDIYRRKAKPATSFLHFAAYVSLFPQLIAGPIVRYTEMEEQLRTIPKTVPPEFVVTGIQFFVFGLGKKLLLADLIAARIEPLLSHVQWLDFFSSWLVMVGYSMQIYFDFSGYSDMAVGLGLLLGFRLPQNFDSPYKSKSISEFWRRWHMTLSSWLRDYLYFSMGGSKKGPILTLLFLVITMFLGGLWHGAAWTFVAWGLYHGVLLVIYHIWKNQQTVPLPAGIAKALTFLAVLIGWVFFRAASFQDAFRILGSMGGFHGFDPIELSIHVGLVLLLVIAGAIALFLPNTFEILPLQSRRRTAFALAILLSICVLRFSAASPFLYFQF